VKKSTKEILDKLSGQNYSNSTRYKFNKKGNRYADGRVVIYNWISELCLCFQKRENELLIEFEKVILDKRKELNDMKDGEYKQGIIDTLKETVEAINKEK